MGPTSKDVEKQGREVEYLVPPRNDREILAAEGGDRDWFLLDTVIENDVELCLSHGDRGWVRVRSHAAALDPQAQSGRC